jgi:hypothetical protein
MKVKSLDVQLPLNFQSARGSFITDCFVTALTVRHPREDFELETNNRFVSMTLFERIHRRVATLRYLRAKRPGARMLRCENRFSHCVDAF